MWRAFEFSLAVVGAGLVVVANIRGNITRFELVSFVGGVALLGIATSMFCFF